jgi:hypothetical protein
MLIKTAITATMYNKYFLVNIIPKFPIFFAITLSSRLFNPNKLDYLTSFKHLAHLWTAYLVNPTKNGINNKLSTPKIRIPNIASR